MALSHIQSNPFIYSSYGPNNPTRRAIFFHGNYIIDYQLIPVQSYSKDDIEEVILTSLVPALSDRFYGAYEGTNWTKKNSYWLVFECNIQVAQDVTAT